MGSTARFKDLLCVVIDVGPTAHTLAEQWPEVLQRVMANRMVQEKPHLELAILAYGSDTTQNELWNPEEPASYKGVHVVQEFSPCKVSTFKRLPAALAPGSGEATSDHYDALVVACDLFFRTVRDRKLTSARKNLVLVSPFLEPIAEVDDNTIDQLASTLEGQIVNCTVSAAATLFDAQAALPPAAAAARTQSLAMVTRLHERGIVGAVEWLSSPWELGALTRAHSAGALYKSPLKIGEFEIAIKAGKFTLLERTHTLKPFAGDPDKAEPEGFVKSDTALFLKGGDPVEDAVEKEDREKMFRFGASYFPVEVGDSYKWQPASDEAAFKGIQVLAFVRDTWSRRGATGGDGGGGDAARADAGEADDEDDDEAEDVFPRWAVLDGPWAVLPATKKAAGALSALARAAASARRMAVVQFGLVSSSSLALGVLVPKLAQNKADFDHFVMFKVPWGNEYASLALPEHAALAESLALGDAQLDAADAFVRARTQPADARLPSDYVTDPVRSCAALAMVRAGIDRNDARIVAGLDGDALARTVLAPGVPDEAAAAAAEKVAAAFPAAVVGEMAAGEDGAGGGGGTQALAEAVKAEEVKSEDALPVS